MDDPVGDARSFLDRSRSALANARTLLRVPGAASSREVRRIGVKGWVAGLVCMVVCGGGMPLLERLDLGGEVAVALVMVPYLVAFYLMVVGGYRVILGRSPAPSRGLDPYAVSWRRTLVATGIAVLSLVVALGVVIPIAWLAERLLEP